MLEKIDHGAVRELRLARPPVNALDAALLDALQREFAGAAREGVRGLVLSGAPGRFSAGLDVPQLLGQDRAGMLTFWRSFFGCLRAFAACPVPVVAAITGHSPAGGAVLALCADRRVMAEGDWRIGLNEVQVGLYPGPQIHGLLARVVGARHAAELLSTGALVDARRALEVGFVDELAPVERVVPRAREWLDGVLALPSRTYLRTRALVRADLVALFAGLGDADAEAMNESWYSEETQATMRALVAKLARKG
jgi:enoyl-CoA hydratase/carnithine racemase